MTAGLTKFSGRRSLGALVATAVIFALVQGFALGHATKYGEAPHTHHGQVCVLSLAAPGGGKASAPAAFVLLVALSFVVFEAAPVIAVPAAKLWARPASRGPPSV